MIKWLSNILTRSIQVKTENQNLANTALRVGSLLEDGFKATPMKWDEDVAYEAGQVAYFNDIRVEATSPTEAGQSPDTHPLKWSKRAVTSGDQITANNHLPVTAAAVYQKLNGSGNGNTGNLPIATPTQKGIARQATDEENNEGVVNDAWTSPKQVHDQLGGYINPTLKNTLANSNGEAGEDNLILQDTSGKPINPFLRRSVEKYFKGLNILNADNSNAGAFGLDTDEAWRLLLGNIALLSASGSALTFYKNIVDFRSAQTTAKTLATTILSLADKQEYIGVPELNADGVWQSKAVPMGAHISQVIAGANDAQIYAKIARFINTQQVEEDERAVELVLCYTEIPELNKQYIPLTYSMIGTPQPHNLFAAGTAIERHIYRTDPSDPDNDENYAYALKVSFPTYSTFLLTTREGATIPTDWVGRLDISRRVPTEEITLSGTQYVLRFTRIVGTEVLYGNQLPDKVYYILPEGATIPAVGTVIKPIANGFRRFSGNSAILSTDCVNVPEPEENGPEWNSLTPPPITPGKDYEWIFPADAVTPGVGTFYEITLTNDHPWLRSLYTQSSFPPVNRIYGTAPLTLSNPYQVGLTAQQLSDNKTKSILVSIPLADAIPMRLMYRYDPANQTLVFRAGADFGLTNRPSLTVWRTDAWSGNLIGNQVMKSYGVLEGGITYFYDVPVFSSPPAGLYYYRLESTAGVRYGSFTLSLSDSVPHVLELSTTHPGTVPGGGELPTPPSSGTGEFDNSFDQSGGELVGNYEDSEAFQVLALDYAFTRNNPPAVQTFMQFWWKVSGTGNLEYAIELVGPVGYELPKSAYSAAVAGVYGNGYTFRGTAATIQSQYILKVYARKAGTTTDLFVRTLPAIPNTGDVPRTNVP